MKNVQWIREGRNYWLQSDGTSLISLTVHPATGSEFILNNRKYSIRTKGVWNPASYVSVNGSEILKLTHRFWGSKGTITFTDGTIYESEYTSKGGLQLCFLNAGHEILSFRIVFENKQPVLKFTMGIEVIDAEILLILAALGMTLFSSIFEEMTGENDNTTATLLLTAI